MRHIWYVTYVFSPLNHNAGGTERKANTTEPTRRPASLYAYAAEVPSSTSSATQGRTRCCAQKMLPHSPVPSHKLACDKLKRAETIPMSRNPRSPLKGCGTANLRRLTPRHFVTVLRRANSKGVRQRKREFQDTGVRGY